MIPQLVIDRIREATDIVELVSRYVTLKKTGKNFKGLCPFHSEKTPSFTVIPDRQFFHCFGCKAGGNAYHFLMRVEGLSFLEAVRDLAGKAGIPVTEESEASQAQNQVRQTLLEVMAWAAERFRQGLRHPKAGAPAREYLKKRGLAPETVERFGLGYAPAGWDNLLRAGERDHYSPALLEQAGLVIAQEGGGRRYDRFRERLMFPITDPQGRVVAFGGRILGSGEPKYLNSPDTPVFQKGELLYGLHQAREAVRRRDRVVLVEGYMDAIACQAKGVEETVAGLGTAFTLRQAQLIRRYTTRVYLAYDADEAGGMAAQRAFEIFNAEGAQVKVVAFSGAKDPDEWLAGRGAGEFEELLAHAQSVIEYMTERACRKHDPKTIEGKLAVKNEILPLLSQLSSPVERGEYVRWLARRLRVEEAWLQQELSMPAKAKSPARPSAEPAAEPLPRAKPRPEEEELAGVLLRYPLQLESVREVLRPEDFGHPLYRRLAELMLAADPAEPEDEEAWLPRLMDRVTDPEVAALASRLAVQAGNQTQPERSVQDCLRRVSAHNLGRELKILQAEIAQAQAEGDLEAFKRLAQKKIELVRRLEALGIAWK